MQITSWLIVETESSLEASSCGAIDESISGKCGYGRELAWRRITING
jgi:hypothetical protein